MALFSSVNDAFFWAFRRRSARPVQSSHLIAPLMKKDRLAEEGPADTPIRALDPALERIPPGLAATAQASMLQSFCIRQPVPRNLHLLSKFAHGETQLAARRALRDFILPLLVQKVKPPKYVVYSLLGRHYGRRDVTIKDLARRMVPLIECKDGETDEKHFRRVSRQVRELERDVDGWLSQIASQTEDACFEQLSATGVVV